MADKELETATEEEELEAPSVPLASETEDDAETSTPSGVTEERLLELLAANNEQLLETINSGVVDEVAERAAQGWKDRRLGRFETQLDELLDIKTAVESAEGDWSDVIADFQARQREEEIYDRLMDRVAQNIPTPQPEADARAEWVAEWQGAVQKVRDKLAEANVEYDEADLTALTNGNFPSPSAARDALADYQVSALTGAAPPEVPASAAAIEGGGEAPPTSEEPTSPQEDYDQGLANLQEMIRVKGAGSAEAKKAQADLDEIVERQTRDYFGE